MADSTPTNTQTLHATLPLQAAGRRLDAVLAEQFNGFSRSQIQQWIKSGKVVLDGLAVLKPNHKVLGGERVELTAEFKPQVHFAPQPVPLEIVHEDEEILVINKAAGQVVHPGAGNPDGTLLNGLLYHAPDLEKLPRAGIVHRLDKETTGLMVVAKTPRAQNSLIEQLSKRTVERVYDALVQGELIAGGTVEKNIGRHPKDRKRMAALDVGGKPAVTHYRVHERFRGFTHVRCKLETGRTHQIRVHMALIGHPLLGDPVYGGRLRIPKGMAPAIIEQLRAFRRQALHAGRLSFIHPATGQTVTFSAPIPDDMAFVIDLLRDDLDLSQVGEAAYDEWDYDEGVDVAWVTDDGQMLEWE